MRAQVGSSTDPFLLAKGNKAKITVLEKSIMKYIIHILRIEVCLKYFKFL
jgi:hypothetical protein